MTKRILSATHKSVLYILASFVLFVLLYFAANAILSRITVNKDVVHTDDITMYIMSNGVHTDVVLPVKTSRINWHTLFSPLNTRSKDTSCSYIAIGWGDKGFYLNTPTWGDLTFKTAFNAVFGLSTTALHVTYHDTLVEGETCRKVSISKSDYEKLIAYIMGSLQWDENMKPINIVTDANYNNYDAFYEAVGSYSMFHTCNTWTNNALKTTGLPAAWWTPFDTGILRHYNQ